MANITKAAGGYFGGRSLVQQSGNRGGARHVFVKIDDIKDDLVFPTFGGQVKNPFQGAAKIFAGDLMEFRTQEDGLKGEVWLLKTYEVVSTSGTTVNVARDGFRHVPFVGDVLTVAPETIGGTGAAMTVVAVTKTKVDKTDVWALTLSAAPTTAPAKGDILVECDSAGKMLVQRINACAAWDYDFMWSESADPSDEDEFEAARYFLTPTLRGTMYESKMSPMPKCVKDLNISNINGWFRFDALNKPTV